MATTLETTPTDTAINAAVTKMKVFMKENGYTDAIKSIKPALRYGFSFEEASETPCQNTPAGNPSSISCPAK